MRRPFRMMFGRPDLAWNRSAVTYSMVKMGRGLEMCHLGANSTRRTSEEQGGTRSFLELPTRPIRGTSVAPALQPRAGRIPDLIYG